MTPIKRRKRQKFVYCIFACEISCHHYTMSEDVIVTLVLKRQLFTEISHIIQHVQ